MAVEEIILKEGGTKIVIDRICPCKSLTLLSVAVSYCCWNMFVAADMP